VNLVQRLIETEFMPHGYCYLWFPEVLWLHVLSDGLIALAEPRGDGTLKPVVGFRG
jgi:two-component system, NtrC family, sensor kinase